MKNPQEIERFIRICFKEYSLNYSRFFSYRDHNDVWHDEPIVVDGELQLPVVEQAAYILGVSVDDLLNMNERAVFKWFDRYGYFREMHYFQDAYRCSFHDKKSWKEWRLIEEMLQKPAFPTRYDFKEVMRRMLELLKEMDKSVPGTYHKGAEINKLSIYTQNFTHFNKIGLMVDSYLEMIARAKSLFFKAWDCNLSEDEVSEYNFLVTALSLHDCCYGRDLLYYDLLKQFIPVYKEEGYRDFKSYVKILVSDLFEPWKCAEFVQDRNMVQKFLNVCPQAKPAMRQFALDVSQFACLFVWSDSPMIPCGWTKEEKAELAAVGINPKHLEYDDAFDDVPLAQEPIRILVPKTEEELDGDGQYAEQLRLLSGPASLGGIILPKTEVSEHFDADSLVRIQTRLEARRRGMESDVQ